MTALRWLLLCCLMLANVRPSVAQGVRLEGLEERAELIQLFDGKSLDGWGGSTNHWSANDGELVGKAERALSGPQYLFTERPYSNFRLVFEARIVAGTGFVLAFGGACSMPKEVAVGCDARVVKLSSVALKATDSEWAKVELIVVGQRVRLAINGRELADGVVASIAPIEAGPIAIGLVATEQPQELRLRELAVETHPGLTFQTVKDDVPPRVAIVELERTVDPHDATITHWTKLTEAIVPDELLQPTRGTRLPLTSMGVREVERDAYYALTQKARELPLATLHQAANEWLAARRALPEHRKYARLPVEKFPLFADLFRDPTAHHGKLVTLRGHVRRLDEMPADENPYGIEKLYQVWLFDEHAQQNPTVIVCTSIDARLKPEPDTLINHCRVTGYFFKNMAYDAQRDLRFAPLLIAQKLEYAPPANGGIGITESLLQTLTRATGLNRASLLVTGLLLLCVLSLLVVIRLQRRRPQAKMTGTTTNGPSFSNVTDNDGKVSFSRLPQADAESSKPSRGKEAGG